MGNRVTEELQEWSFVLTESPFVPDLVLSMSHLDPSDPEAEFLLVTLAGGGFRAVGPKA